MSGMSWQSMCLLSHCVYLLYFPIGSQVSVVDFICFGVYKHGQPWFGLMWVLPIFQKQNSVDIYHYATNPT
jgi:hypothetical protein